MSDEEDSAPAEATDPVKILEGLLRRFQLLNGTVAAFQRDVANMQPLPPYPQLMTRITAMRDSANDLVAELNNHQSLLNTRVVTPAPHWAARYHLDYLGGLFRTKLEPNVEDWEHQHLNMAQERENKQDREKKDGSLSTLSERDRLDLWDWAPPAAQREAMSHVWFQADYTKAEKDAGVENVVHGLKRPLVLPELPDADEDEDEDQDEEDDFEDVDGNQPERMDLDIAKPSPQPSDTATAMQEPTHPLRPPMPMDKILRFMAKGEMP